MNYSSTSNSSSDMTAGGCVFAFVSLPMVMAISMIANAWALMLLWRWFVLPVFTEAPALTIPAAIGISLVVGFLTTDSDEYGKEKMNQKSIYELVLIGVSRSLFRPAWAVAIGYIVLLLT